MSETAKKISLAPELPPAQSALEVAAMLEGLLERAKTGEIVALGAAYVTRFRDGGSMVAGSVERVTLLGSVAHLQSRIIKALDGGT